MRPSRCGATLTIAGLWSVGALAQEAAPPPHGPPAAPAHQAGHQHPAPPEAATPPPTPSPKGEDPSAHRPGESILPPFIPAVTEADRAAAFQDVHGHAMHDRDLNYVVLFDQLEWQAGAGARAFSWDNTSWIGRDRDRLWVRTEGQAGGTRLEDAQAHLLYGRRIARWWDVVAGVRHDVGAGPSRTWAAVGVQGLAPYGFQVDATAYLGAAGRTQVRLEAEYELLVTNRVVLQPLIEAELYGKADPGRDIGAGLASADAGLRLRYEIRRELAPYIGVVWSRKFFGTADYARATGARAGGARLALGLRFWL